MRALKALWNKARRFSGVLLVSCLLACLTAQAKAPPLAVYIDEQPFSGKVILIDGTVYVEKKPFVEEAGLPAQATLPQSIERVLFGDTYVSLPGYAKWAGEVFAMNRHTGIVDVYAYRLSSTGAAGPTVVIPPPATFSIDKPFSLAGFTSLEMNVPPFGSLPYAASLPGSAVLPYPLYCPYPYYAYPYPYYTLPGFAPHFGWHHAGLAY